jgi:hypothetical protein
VSLATHGNMQFEGDLYMKRFWKMQIMTFTNNVTCTKLSWIKKLLLRMKAMTNLWFCKCSLWIVDKWHGVEKGNQYRLTQKFILFGPSEESKSKRAKCLDKGSKEGWNNFSTNFKTKDFFWESRTIEE